MIGYLEINRLVLILEPQDMFICYACKVSKLIYPEDGSKRGCLKCFRLWWKLYVTIIKHYACHQILFCMCIFLFHMWKIGSHSILQHVYTFWVVGDKTTSRFDPKPLLKSNFTSLLWPKIEAIVLKPTVHVLLRQNIVFFSQDFQKETLSWNLT